MGAGQAFRLFSMAMIGLLSLPVTVSWSDMPKGKRCLLIAWLAFWFGPPLYFVWTKGVLG